MRPSRRLRSGWRPGFYMKPKHIGLVFCVSLVGCMVAFGGGFIVGMGYKASEQVSPYAVKRPPTVQSADQQNVSSAVWKEESLTFYDSLIRPVEMMQAPESVPTTAAPPTPTPAPPVQSVAAEETGLDPQTTDQGMTATETPQAPSPSPAAPGTAISRGCSPSNSACRGGRNGPGLTGGEPDREFPSGYRSVSGDNI